MIDFILSLVHEAVVQNNIESINRAEKAFEPSAIVELKKLDIRLRAASELLENHVAQHKFLLRMEFF